MPMQCIFFSQGFYLVVLQQGSLFKLASLQNCLGVIGNSRPLSLTRSNQFLHAYSLMTLMWLFNLFV